MKYRVVAITNNLNACADNANGPWDWEGDTKEFPELIDYVEDEAVLLVIGPEKGQVWTVEDFFNCIPIKEFEAILIDGPDKEADKT